MNPKIMAAQPNSGESAKYVGARKKINAPKIISKNPPLFLLLCSA